MASTAGIATSAIFCFKFMLSDTSFWRDYGPVTANKSLIPISQPTLNSGQPFEAALISGGFMFPQLWAGMGSRSRGGTGDTWSVKMTNRWVAKAPAQSGQQVVRVRWYPLASDPRTLRLSAWTQWIPVAV